MNRVEWIGNCVLNCNGKTHSLPPMPPGMCASGPITHALYCKHATGVIPDKYQVMIYNTLQQRPDYFARTSALFKKIVTTTAKPKKGKCVGATRSKHKFAKPQGWSAQNVVELD